MPSWLVEPSVNDIASLLSTFIERYSRHANVILCLAYSPEDTSAIRVSEMMVMLFINPRLLTVDRIAISNLPRIGADTLSRSTSSHDAGTLRVYPIQEYFLSQLVSAQIVSLAQQELSTSTSILLMSIILHAFIEKDEKYNSIISYFSGNCNPTLLLL